MSVFGRDFIYRRPLFAAFFIFAGVELTYFLVLEHDAYVERFTNTPLLFLGVLVLKLLIFIGLAYLFRYAKLEMEKWR